ncbi:MAG: PP2C family protein-serine/threonine phosphatase [bacterium]|nr:PP2C family protein-serine/threonine phosphatase [bacterium]
MNTDSNRRRRDLIWVATGLLAALAVMWSFPRAYPLFPTDWTVSKEEAVDIALERIRDLGELPSRPYVLARLNSTPVLEPMLQAAEASRDEIRQSAPGRELLIWEVVVYRRDSPSNEWEYRVRVRGDAEVSELRRRVPPDEARPDITDAEAARRADAFLGKQGFDLADFDPSQIRQRQLQARTDRVLRYRDRESVLGEDFDYGLEVLFAGNELTGFARYFDDPGREAFQRTLQTLTLLQQAWIFMAVLLVPLIAVPFVRRYHAGEIGVRRGLQILAAAIFCGALILFFCGRVVSAGVTIGVLTRPQTTFVVVFQLMLLYFFPLGFAGFLSWSVGESLCRTNHPHRLAAFDALFQGRWLNATFARSSLRGLVAGLLVSAALLALAALVRGYGAWASTAFLFGLWWESASWFSVPLLASAIVAGLYGGLFGRLFLVSYLERRIGIWGAAIVATVVGAFLFFPMQFVFPTSWSPVFWILPPLVFVVLFVRYGIMTSILAQMTVLIVLGAGPFLGVADPAMQFQASLALLAVSAPLIVSVRHLWSGREFLYRYEDVPPHVRRIADRERQKVELETARRIQTSILPELPPQLNGVEMTHSYLPATEVGGDFYDVLALEDGRLAVAVGDVAGHGVSSGLVMSMAKSALSVQVTFNPEVEAVFSTLNRMVYQSARKRLLTTLCYALVDPAKREMFFASAGHLFPYRISSRNEVQALESVSYPLGVRDEIDVRVRSANLEAGDYLFMFSDGVVEARDRATDELFGFERLERSLKRHAGGSVQELRRGVLADLDEFTGPGPRDDDLTVLVLRLP